MFTAKIHEKYVVDAMVDAIFWSDPTSVVCYCKKENAWETLYIHIIEDIASVHHTISVRISVRVETRVKFTAGV